MKFKSTKRTYSLSGKDIDACSAFLEDALEAGGVERQNKLRIRLTIEELLLRFREQFGEEHLFQISLSRKLGHPSLTVELEGMNYNPLAEKDDDQEDWNSSVLNTLGIRPQFYYSGNRNTIRISLPTPKMNPVLRMIIAMVLALIVGLLVKSFLPEAAITISGDWMTPVYDLWTRGLNLISGPVIFFMVVTTMISLKRLSIKGASSKLIVGRYFLISAAIAVFIVVIATLVQHMAVARQPLNSVAMVRFVDFFFQFVPSNIISPFIEANTPQLIFMALMLGVMLNVLRGQVPNLIRIVNQINSVCLLMAEWISYLVPVFTCLLLGMEIVEGRLGMFLRLWMPLVMSIILTAVVLSASIARLSLQKRVPIKTLLAKMKQPFLTALQRGSISASYGETEYSCTRQLGIDREFTQVSLSNGIVLYMPASILGTLVFFVWVASFYQVQVTWGWYAIAALFAAILMEAAPPVPGVSLLVFIVIFQMLDIPDEALIPAMVFDILFGIVSAAANQMLLQVEMVHQADRMGLLNRDMLKAPMEKQG